MLKLTRGDMYPTPGWVVMMFGFSSPPRCLPLHNLINDWILWMTNKLCYKIWDKANILRTALLYLSLLLVHAVLVDGLAIQLYNIAHVFRYVPFVVVFPSLLPPQSYCIIIQKWVCFLLLSRGRMTMQVMPAPALASYPQCYTAIDL